MSGTYSIEVEPSGFMKFVLAGFFDEDTADRLNLDRAAAFEKLRCPPNAHVKLVDVSQFDLQSQVIGAMLQRMMSDPKTRSRRIAFVGATALLQLQTKRLVGDRPDIQFFANQPSAERWLREVLAK